jgi:predicted Zn-dependent protease
MSMIERFEGLLATGKETALVRFTLGGEYLKAGEASKACAHLERAVALDAQYSAAWKLLGRARSDLGDAPGAMAAYDSGIAAAQVRGDKQAAREMAVFRKRLTSGRAETVHGTPRLPGTG